MSSVRSLVETGRLSDKQRLDLLCAWLLDHLFEPLGWHELSRQSGMSNEELNQLFGFYHEVTPMQWIRLQREKLMSAMGSCSSSKIAQPTEISELNRFPARD